MAINNEHLSSRLSPPVEMAQRLSHELDMGAGTGRSRTPFSRNVTSRSTAPTQYDESSSDDDDNLTKQRMPIEVYKEYIIASTMLEKNLDDFAHNVQKLGSALELSMASRNVRSELRKVRQYFESTSERMLEILARDVKKKNRLSGRGTPKRVLSQSDVSISTDRALDHRCRNIVSDSLDELLRTLRLFALSLQDFEDYVDRDGEKSLKKFIQQIAMLSECLSIFGSDCDSQVLQRFIEGKTVQMKMYLKEMDIVLQRFSDVGIPCISAAQKRTARMLLNAATIATFFAGVSATTLQFSVGSNDTATKVAANALWFASLVLSIGSAINGLLAMTWRQAVFSSPNRRLPQYIQFWTRQGYLVLLTMSVMTFLGGLLCFMLATQDRVSFWLSAGCIIFLTFGLASVSFWFGVERWNFAKFRNADHIDYGMNSLTRKSNTFTWSWTTIFTKFKRSDDAASECSRQVLPRFKTKEDDCDDWVDHSGVKNSSSFLNKLRDAYDTNFRRRHNGSSVTPGNVQLSQDSSSITSRPRFHENVQAPHLDRTFSGSTACSYTQQGLGTGLHEQKSYCSRIQDLTGQDLLTPNSIRMSVRHIQLSPCGVWLIVCWKTTSALFKLDELHGFKMLHKLEDPRPHARKVALLTEWSPDGKRVLIMYPHGVSLWELRTEDAKLVHKRSIRELSLRNLQDVQWLSDDEFIALSRDSVVVKMSLRTGSVTRRNLPTGQAIHSVRPLDKCDRILFLATHSFGDATIDYIMVYNLNSTGTAHALPEGQIQSAQAVLGGDHSAASTAATDYSTGIIEQKIPLLFDVESITVSSDCRHVIISYEEGEPELWHYGRQKWSSREGDMCRLSFSCRMASICKPLRTDTGDTSDKLWRWGDACFLGPNNSFVACPADDTIHIWDRRTGDRLSRLCVGDGLLGDYEASVAHLQYNWVDNSGVMTLATASGRDFSRLQVWRSPTQDLSLESPGAAPSPTITDGTKAETILPTFVVSPAPAVHEVLQEAEDYFSYRPTSVRNSVSV